MSQIAGTGRITNSYSNIDQGDAKLQQQLAVYKVPATIRDLKQTFLYVQINADTTVTHPAILYTGKEKKVPEGFPISVNPYYLPLGTKTKFKVGEAVNSLLDLRVPKDKYVVEINLVEAQIEANPKNWTNIPEFFLTPPSPGTDLWGVERIYQIKNDYVLSSTGIPQEGGSGPTSNTLNADPPIRNLYTVSYDQASKESIPQSLFCRINGMNNSEPYNWVVTSNGQVALDKSHLLMVKHGDVNYDELELEYGHLVFKGTDQEYANYIGTEVYSSTSNVGVPNINEQRADYTPATQATANKVLGEKSRFTNYEYLDYNWEWRNARKPPYTQIKIENGWSYANDYPANRNNTQAKVYTTAKFYADGTPNNEVVTATDLYLKNDPLKSNQQASNLYLRFMIKLIHLF